MGHRLRLGAGLLALCFLGLSLGCAVGKSASGEAVIGVPVGISPDASDAQAIGAGIGSLFGPGGAAAGGALAAGLAGLLGWGRSAAARRTAEAKAAELSGAERGWTEREQAASVQHPLDRVPVNTGSGGTVDPGSRAVAQTAVPGFEAEILKPDVGGNP